MKLDVCTPAQRQSIEHVHGPLLVSAGAGSGKTFTLAQRIAYALLPESGPAVAGIDEICAITFTEKAAAEIKARVKRTLRAEGLSKEALRVDGAWISTIHGMCARILRTHALDLGLDPAFDIMGEAERADAIAEAVSAALGQDNEIVSRGSYEALFDEFKARSSMPSETSVASMLQTIIDKAAGMVGGLEALDFGPAPADPAGLARDLLLAYEALLPVIAQAKKSETSERACRQAADAVEALERFLAQGSRRAAAAEPQVAAPAAAAPAAGTDPAAPAPAAGEGRMRELAAAVEACAFLPRTFGNAAVKAAVGEYQAVHERVCQQVALALASPAAADLAALAREVHARFERAKQEAGTLDNDDLLVLTLAAFKRHPAIARRYEQRFKLLMVDEFQDTSQLQIDLIARLAGESLEHLCTVGDAQQSIYRFRGADVKVYEEHRRTMRSEKVGALYVELAKNFRSHGDVLCFVDRVFEQPQVFGKAFMSLEPNEGRTSRYRGSAPRIDLVLSLQPPGRAAGVRAADLKRSSAEAIAGRFAALREDGHAPGDMVVLLGKMSRADVYAEALRAEGFECAVTGGSLFASAPEVRVVARLVETIANPANTAALFEVLTSDMLGLSADDLLELSTERDEASARLRRRDLDKGFARLAELEDCQPARLADAVRLIDRAQREAQIRTVADVVRDAVVRSGWMARLEGQGAAGLARAANVLKAVRLIDRLESERSLGLAQTARALRDELAAGLKEAPGALSAAAGGVVKLMTIHASKGLEFPIVALADFADVRAAGGRLLVETCGAMLRASLAPGRSLEAYPGLAKRASVKGAAFDGDEEGDDADRAAARRFVEGGDRAAGLRGASGGPCSQAAYRAVLLGRAAEEELAEARRKLYVGLTRASEALIVAMEAKEPSSGKAASYAPLVDDVRSALCGGGDFPDSGKDLPYGGSAPARFERIALAGEPKQDAGGEAPGQDAGSEAPGQDAPAAAGGQDALAAAGGQDVAAQPARFFVPVRDEGAASILLPFNARRSEVFSYSSIAPARPPIRAVRPRRRPGDPGGPACPGDPGDPGRLSGAQPAPPGAHAGQAAPPPAASGGEPPDHPASGSGGAPAASRSGNRSPDADKATGLGSAFHRAAQLAVETGRVPDAGQVAALGAAYELSEAQSGRLKAACARWFVSPIYAEARSWPLARAEVPFCVAVGEGYLEGEIDLLCTQLSRPAASRAFVVDYKTGGLCEEEADALQAKHLLQAQCYAYAVLSQGFEGVELAFVRVEHEGCGGGPQCLRYRFGPSDVDALAQSILQAWKEA